MLQWHAICSVNYVDWMIVKLGSICSSKLPREAYHGEISGLVASFHEACNQLVIYYLLHSVLAAIQKGRHPFPSTIKMIWFIRFAVCVNFQAHLDSSVYPPFPNTGTCKSVSRARNLEPA